MESILDYKGDRGLRLLDIFERLNRGELLNKRAVLCIVLYVVEVLPKIDYKKL